MTKYILAIDQGTTSTRALVFDEELSIVSTDQKEFKQHFPNSGWVEHDPEDIWQTTLETCQKAINFAAVSPSDILSIGITINEKPLLFGTGKLVDLFIEQLFGKIEELPSYVITSKNRTMNKQSRKKQD